LLSAPPPYRVEDRSVLLPSYKRWLVDPVLPRLPQKLSPNSITHGGHVLCLLAMFVLYPAPRGWAFAASALLLHLYLWCDNADGAHARRTGQASTAGEYLDHGLDLVNCVYIGVISACAIDLQSHTMGLAIATLIACAAAVTLWEQAVTGVFRLGLLNQIESMIFLTAVMLIDAVFGVELVERVTVFGFALQSWIWFFVFSTVAFGIVRSVIRVAAAKKSVAPAVGLLALLGAIWSAHSAGAASTLVAYGLCVTSIVAFGVRMLRTRIVGGQPSGPVKSMPFVAASAVLAATRWLPDSIANAAVSALALGAIAIATLDTLVVVRRATSPRQAAIATQAPNAE
jgi:phosphatidylglycerophosphate synthase